MTYRLAGIRAKLERATEHLETLEREIAALPGPDMYSLVYEREGEPQSKVGIIRYRILREPPLRLGVLAGEAIQQLRSSLDHLALQLAQRRWPRLDTANFPIYTSKTTYTTKVGTKNRSPQDNCRRVFRPEDLTRIEKLQPYKESVPAKADLAILQRLSNLDKHALIHTPLSVVGDISITPQQSGLWVLWVNPEASGILDDNTPIMRVGVASEPPEMKVDWHLRLGVVFGEEAVTVERLKELAVRVVGIIDEFEVAIPDFQPT